MKHLISKLPVFALFATLLFSGVIEPARGAEDKDRAVTVGVVAFVDTTHNNLSEAVLNETETSVSGVKRIEKVERAHLPTVLKELKLNEDGTIAGSDQKRLGEIRGVDYIIYGSVYAASINSRSKMTTCKVTINFALTKLPGGETQNFKCEGQSQRTTSFGDSRQLYQEAIAQAVEKFQNDLFQKLFQMGKTGAHIIQIKPDEGFFRIDQGEQDGIAENMIFEVVRVTQEKEDNRVFEDEQTICLAIVKQVQKDSAKLYPGKVDSDIISGKHWHDDKSLFTPDEKKKRPGIDKSMTLKFKEMFKSKKGLI